MKKIFCLFLLMVILGQIICQEEPIPATEEEKVDINEYDKVEGEKVEPKTPEEIEIEEWEKNIENFNPEYLYTIKVVKGSGEVS